jgi:hypothetical protein
LRLRARRIRLGLSHEKTKQAQQSEMISGQHDVSFWQTAGRMVGSDVQNSILPGATRQPCGKA